MDTFHLLDTIDSEYMGIIWLTQGPMSLYSNTGQTLNYLSGGLLGESYAHHAPHSEQELFCKFQNFGEDFFIIQKEIKSPLSCKISNIEFIKAFTRSAQNKIAIISEAQSISPKYLLEQCRETISWITLVEIHL